MFRKLLECGADLDQGVGARNLTDLDPEIKKILDGESESETEQDMSTGEIEDMEELSNIE